MSRVKKEYRSNSKQRYQEFLKENNISEKELSFDKFSKNLEVCNWMFIEYALRTGEKISLPYGFGPIVVTKKKYKTFKEKDGKKYVNLKVNWKKTKEVGKKVYHTNEHTDGYNFRWMWFPGEAKLPLSDIYMFKPGRYMSRAINKYLRKDKNNYKDIYLEWGRKK